MCMLHFRHSDSRVKYRNRPAKDGPEARLLGAFMAEYEKHLKGNGGDYAIFYEPQLPTGYPDCVVVKFEASAYAGWGKDTVPLSDTDMRLLSILAMSRGLSPSTLARRSGFDPAVVDKSLEKLRVRGFAGRRGSRWVAVPRRRSSGIREILSIEAKMTDCSGAMDQAVLNTTFADASYVLMPTRHPSPQTLSAAKNAGLGIFLLPGQGPGTMLLKPVAGTGSRASYATWCFNEWIGRRLAKTRRKAK